MDFYHPLTDSTCPWNLQKPKNTCCKKDFSLLKQTFQEKCETWLEFVSEVDQKLAVEISRTYQGLQEQQKTHKLFQMVKHSKQFLYSIIEDGQCILDQAQVENRDTFHLKLSLLRIQWEAVTILAQQRIEMIDHQISKELYSREKTERLKNIFNEKYKEFCMWLAQMKSKVSQNVNIYTEEIIQKLEKDYQDEMSVALVKKNQLQQIVESLAKSSNECKEFEIHNKVDKVNYQWQQLLVLIGERVKELKMMFMIQQLDKNISKLRTWLLNTEFELPQLMKYKTNDTGMIKRKLEKQQELQREIEKKSTAVAPVPNLCQVLLHHCKACATSTQRDSIQKAMHNLVHRWRNICAMSEERRLQTKQQHCTSNSIAEMAPLKVDKAVFDTNFIQSEWDNSNKSTQELEILICQTLHLDGENERSNFYLFDEDVNNITGESDMEPLISQLSQVQVNSNLYLQETGSISSKTPWLDASSLKVVRKCRMSTETRKECKKMKEIILCGILKVTTIEIESYKKANKTLPIKLKVVQDTFQARKLLTQNKCESFKEMPNHKLFNADNFLEARVCVICKTQSVMLKEITRNVEEIEKLIDIASKKPGLSSESWSLACVRKTQSKLEMPQSIGTLLQILLQLLILLAFLVPPIGEDFGCTQIILPDPFAYIMAALFT